MSQERAVHSGVDWAGRWRRMVEERDEQVARLPGRTERAGPAYWDRRADEWRRLGGMQPQPEVMEALAGSLTPDASVLDVGAGIGRYAVPMARLVRRVVAVEPSDGMRRYLQEDVEQLGLRNVTVVGASWLEAEVEPADVVLCSHVVYGVRDMVPFVRKLDAHARRAVYVVIRLSQFDEDVRPLWEQVWGEPRKPEPGFIELYNLLYALGIRANVRLVPFVGRRTFASPEEAVETAAGMLFLPEDAGQRDTVRRYVQDRLRRAEDGSWTWALPPLQAAVVWWER